MADKKATRESYGRALAELGEKYDFLVLDADLAAATKTGMFKKAHPDRMETKKYCRFCKKHTMHKETK